MNKPSLFLARSITSLTSFTPLFIALKVKKGLLLSVAIILANVVLPVPGGPQKISEGIKPFDIC